MKIVLFSTPAMDYHEDKLIPIGYDASRECPPYGVYLLAEALRHNQYDVKVIDLIADGNIEIDLYFPLISNADLIGISATTLSWPAALEIIKSIREKAPDIPIVLGGIHPSMFPRYILDMSGADYILTGEAEYTLPLLCRYLELNSFSLNEIPGLYWKDEQNRIIGNNSSKRLSPADLSNVPIPNFSFIPNKAYKGLSIETSRGCSFNCSFCSATYRRQWVPLSPESVVLRLAAAMDHTNRTKLGLIYIIDDEFSSNSHRCIRITDILINRGLSPRLTYDSRINDLLEDGFISAMKPFTSQILAGAECGYDEGLKQIGKGTTIKNIERAAFLLHKYDLSTVTDFSFIIGFPWETTKEIYQTIDFAMNIFSKYGVRILLQWYLQMPASRLWIKYRNTQQVHEAMYNDFGFFRNIYLFRTANQLEPSQIWEIAKSVEMAKVISRLRFPEKQMIEHSLPLQIYENFPERYLS